MNADSEGLGRDGRAALEEGLGEASDGAEVLVGGEGARRDADVVLDVREEGGKVGKFDLRALAGHEDDREGVAVEIVAVVVEEMGLEDLEGVLGVDEGRRVAHVDDRGPNERVAVVVAAVGDRDPSGVDARRDVREDVSEEVLWEIRRRDAELLPAAAVAARDGPAEPERFAELLERLLHEGRVVRRLVLRAERLEPRLVGEEGGQLRHAPREAEGDHGRVSRHQVVHEVGPEGMAQDDGAPDPQDLGRRAERRRLVEDVPEARVEDHRVERRLYGKARLEPGGIDAEVNRDPRLRAQPGVAVHFGVDATRLEARFSVEAAFDAVVFNACFGNVFDQAAALGAAAEVLRVGGAVVLSHPLGSDFVDDLVARDASVVPFGLPRSVPELAALLPYETWLEPLRAEDEAPYYASFVKKPFKKLREPLGLRGPVARGYGRGGKKLGVPTANLPEDLFGDVLSNVPTGVYSAWVAVSDGGDDDGDALVRPAVVNVGYSPTFVDAENPLKILEAHLLDYDGDDFYGDSLAVVLVSRQRPEVKFPDFPTLLANIKNDIRVATGALATDQDLRAVRSLAEAFLKGGPTVASQTFRVGVQVRDRE